MMTSLADSSRLALDTLLAVPSSPPRDDAVSFGNQATVCGESGSERGLDPGMSHDGAAPLGVGAVDNHALFSQVASRLGLGDGGPATLTQIGRFHVIRRLGEGGMGVVYQAYDPALDRPVAIKLLHPRLVRGRGLAVAEQRMRREARAMARVGHANVVTIHEVGTRDGQLYLVMEYVNGRTLTEWLSEETRGWRATLEMFLRAGEGLAAAHAVDFVHRDFKPETAGVRTRPPRGTA